MRTFGSRNRLPGGGEEDSVITQEVQQAINDQINREVYAAYLYLAMSAYQDSENFSGMARWMRAQYEEELVHALKFVDFMTDKGGVVRLQAVEAPPSDFTSPLNCFEASLEHEREVTQHLANLYDLAWRQKDHAAHVLLEWFMAEQVEEEKTAEEIVAKLRLAGDNGAALLVMETELGKRNGASATATEPVASV